MEDQVYRPGVILDIQPVPDILPLPIDRKRPTLPDVVDEQRNQLLRELVWSVIVGTVCDYGRHPVSVVIGSHEMVTRSLGGGIRTMRLILAVLREEPLTAFIAIRITFRPCQHQSPIDLVSRNMIEPLPLPTLRLPKLTGCLKQSQCAKDICLREYERIRYRTVHVAFSGQMDDSVN